MANPKYFLHLTNDHRVSKNKLEDEARREIRNRFDCTVTDSIEDSVKSLQQAVDHFNAKYPRCNPLRTHFQEKRDHPGSNEYFYIPSLLTINFYEIKETADCPLPTGKEAPND